MTDIRARLAEEHWNLYVSSCRDLASCSHIPDTFAELSESEQAYHYRYADTLLSMPGIAIVDREAVLKEHRCINTVDRYLGAAASVALIPNLQCAKCHTDWPCPVTAILAAALAADGQATP